MHFREPVIVAVELGTGKISVLARKGSRLRATSAEAGGIMRGSALAVKEKEKERAVRIKREKEKERKRVKAKAKAKERGYLKAKERERAEKAKVDFMS